jgi:WD40 repeat protein
MFSSQPAEISLGTQCRTLTAVRADKVESRFLAGSSCIRRQEHNNHLYVLRYHSDGNELGLDAKIPHETGAVAAICSSPTDSSVVLTAAEGSTAATVWKLPHAVMQLSSGPSYDDDDDDDDDGSDPANNNSEILNMTNTETMEALTTLEASGTDLVDVQWRDAGEEASAGDVVTVDWNGRLCQWDVGFGEAHQVQAVDGSSDKRLDFPARVAWDPHGNGNSVALSKGPKISILDWRVDASVPSGTVHTFEAHRYAVTSLDYNPNKPYVLATAGQDSLVKFWDLRSAKQPLLVARGGHSHWAYNVMYNPFHDQLVLSSGTDSFVNLWRCSTISSAPLMTMYDNDDEASADRLAQDVQVDRYEHNDSVYGLCWGAADAWIYLSLGYDGKVVASHVPSKEKYKILL